MERLSAAAAATILAYGIVTIGCTAGQPPRPTADAFVRGQVQRIIDGSIDRVWPDVVAALEDEGVTVDTADRERGVLACRPIRVSGGRSDLLRDLREIAHLEAARGRLRRVSEYSVTYTLFLAPVAEDTTLKIAAQIHATDRSQAVFFGPGLVQVIPVRVPLPSKGVVERRLFQRVAGVLFGAEEMFYYVGLLGYE